MAINKIINDNAVIFLLAITGIIGFYFGMFHAGTLQSAIESAQVLAGIVKYPPSNPFYIYHVKLWTIINQILALFLYLGVSEYALSLAVSGIMGMLVFQAISLLVWALSRNFSLSLCATLILFMYIKFDFSPLALTGRYYDSLVYPLFLMGNKATFSGIGLPYMLLTLALIGGGYYRISSFLIGLAPSVHFSLGISLVICVIIAFLFEQKSIGSEWKKMLIFGSIGGVISVVSYLIQLHFAANIDAPTLTREMKAAFLTTFVKYNDQHRSPVNLFSWGILAQIMAIIISWYWMRFFRNDLSQSNRYLLRTFLILSCSSLFLGLLSHLQDILPIEFLIMMPGRVQNIVLLAFPAVLIGLLGSRSGELWSLIVLEVLLLTLLAVIAFHIHVAADMIPAIAAISFIALHRVLFIFKKQASPTRSLRTLNRGVIVLTLILAIVYMGNFINMHTNMWESTKSRIFDWRYREGFNWLKEGNGYLLLGPDIDLIQHSTRRPVLIDPMGITQVPYALEGVPMMDSIMREIYGAELFGPNAKTWDGYSESTMNLWKSRTRQEWQHLALKFGFTKIITNQYWKLNLPVEFYIVIAKDFDYLIIYNIP